MYFSALNYAMSSKQYEKIADICDELLLQVAIEGITYQEEWPYAIHLLGHLYISDINSARFLWISIPSLVKENRPKLPAAWRSGQRLWTRDYARVHEAIRGFDWSPEAREFMTSLSDLYTKKMFELLLSAYSTISIQDISMFLEMSQDDAIKYVVEQSCWDVDIGTWMLIMKKQAITTVQKLDSGKLQRLTEYVFHFEH